MTLAERFWPKVAICDNSECWPWLAARERRTGYGRFSLHNPWTGIYGPLGAHRVAYLLTSGHFDRSLGVLHHCDNRLCCNPSHLFLGTAGDNAADAVAKGRLPLAAANLSKDSCPLGHPYSGANLYVNPRGDRACRACRRLASRRYAESQRGRLSALTTGGVG